MSIFAKAHVLAIFEDALRFAVDAHAGMVRKSVRTPYILHPMEVANIAATMTDDIEVLSAAVLHDVVEDTPYTLDEIGERFGSHVAALVAAETEDKRPELPAADTWRIRKEKSLALYLGTEDEGRLREVEDKARIVGYTRIMRRAIRRGGLETDGGRAVIENARARLEELIPQYDTLLF